MDNCDGHIMKVMRNKKIRPDSLKAIVRAYADYETGEWGTEAMEYDWNHGYVKRKLITVIDGYGECYSVPLDDLEEMPLV